MRLITRALLLTGSVMAANSLLTLPTLAAEGMWTMDNLPLGTLEKTYGFKPTPVRNY